MGRLEVRAVLSVGIPLGLLPWIFHGPMVWQGLQFSSQRGDAVLHLAVGVATTVFTLAAMALLRREPPAR